MKTLEGFNEKNILSLLTNSLILKQNSGVSDGIPEQNGAALGSFWSGKRRCQFCRPVNQLVVKGEAKREWYWRKSMNLTAQLRGSPDCKSNDPLRHLSPMEPAICLHITRNRLKSTYLLRSGISLVKSDFANKSRNLKVENPGDQLPT